MPAGHPVDSVGHFQHPPPQLRVQRESDKYVAGFPPGGGPYPPTQHCRGGISPPCWQKILKYFPYFTVISVKIDHFKYQNLKTLIFFLLGECSQTPHPFWTPPLKHFWRKPCVDVASYYHHVQKPLSGIVS